jgi:hypothetical protein
MSDAEYAKPLEVLSDASIGQHTRHVIEFFECLEQSKHTRRLNYDARNRRMPLETCTAEALAALARIMEGLGDADERPIVLTQAYCDVERCAVELPTTYARELVFNIEHAIHHQALIRIGVETLRLPAALPDNFGIADGTVHFRNAHVHADLSA